MSRLWYCIFLILLMVFMNACASLVKEPVITLQRTSIIGLDTAGVDLELYLNVTNPNGFNLSLLGYTYDLQVMALPLANGGALQTVVFPAGKHADIRLPVRLRYNDLIGILKRLPDPEKIPYHVTAKLQVDTPVGELIIPVDERATFAVPEKYRPSRVFDMVLDSLRIRP